MSSRGCDHFVTEVQLLINRMRKEYEMTYAEVVGCLAMLQHDMTTEAKGGD